MVPLRWITSRVRLQVRENAWKIRSWMIRLVRVSLPAVVLQAKRAILMRTKTTTYMGVVSLKSNPPPLMKYKQVCAQWFFDSLCAQGCSFFTYYTVMICLPVLMLSPLIQSLIAGFPCVGGTLQVYVFWSRFRSQSFLKSDLAFVLGRVSLFTAWV